MDPLDSYKYASGVLAFLLVVAVFVIVWMAYAPSESTCSKCQHGDSSNRSKGSKGKPDVNGGCRGEACPRSPHKDDELSKYDKMLSRDATLVILGARSCVHCLRLKEHFKGREQALVFIDLNDPDHTSVLDIFAPKVVKDKVQQHDGGIPVAFVYDRKKDAIMDTVVGFVPETLEHAYNVVVSSS